jgi:hypothetical protein
MAEAIDAQSVFREAVTLTREGRFEEALQKHLWFHEHALEYEPALAGVRLSYALASWLELGEKYPPALAALISIRDAKTKAITDGNGSPLLFHDLVAINDCLKESSRTVELFKTIHGTFPELARQCYLLAESYLVADREYAICASYIPDPLVKFEEIRQLFQVQLEIAEENPSLRDAGIKDYAEAKFVSDVCLLVEILVGVGRKQEAEKVEALGQQLCAGVPSRSRPG